MRKKLLSLFLTVCMLISLVPSVAFPAAAATDIADMDALSALGIDTKAAPEGFDENSLDNPYGKDVVDVSPVYELYTLGLTKVPEETEEQGEKKFWNAYTEEVKEISAGVAAPVNGDGKLVTRDTEISDTKLQSALYGDGAWDETDAAGILGSKKTKDIYSGSMVKTGKYVEITSKETVGPPATYTQTGYLSGAANTSATLDAGKMKYALSSVASGNFDGNKKGLAAQSVMVYTGEYSANGGLYLRFGDMNGYGTNMIKLLGTEQEIGNPGLMDADRPEVPVENFAENPYQLQNYLQVATGDWNGDGIDEVAVYIPEVGNSRIVVYALQLTGGQAYSNASNWKVAWTYSFNEGDVVSNMVSLVNGDVNQDGIDDLAATWGYYYGPGQNAGSTAVVMFGAKGSDMLQNAQEFNLNHGNFKIVRGAFAFGDMAGAGEDVLILCGQSDADLKAGKLYTRYVALFHWNGSAFTSTVNKNFDLFEKKDGDYVNSAMSAALRGSGADKFYSLPLCVSNVAVVSQGIAGNGGDKLYFDSLIISYTDEGLLISEAWDVNKIMQATPASPIDYVEYSAAAGDFTGQTGAATVATMQQSLSAVTIGSTSYNLATASQRPVYVDDYYYSNWVNKLFGIKTWYKRFSHYQTVTGSQTIPVSYEKFSMGKAYLVVADPATSYNTRTETDFSMSLCLTNTDEDSSYMSYTGKHYYTYSDPGVLAVIASPPYFADLLGRGDLSGNYGESTTGYSSSSGSGSGATTTATITAGAYVAFEQEFSVFGVKVASAEAEAVMTAGFTWDTEKTSSLEQTVTYSATSGEDMVAFYSIPLEIYEFDSYVANGKGGHDKVTTTVNIPHEAAVRLLSLDDYEAIAADYSVLPTIADNVLTHTVGNPASYPSNTRGYLRPLVYNGDPASVGYSSAEGGASISQEIAMTKESANAFTRTVGIETKAGAGAGGVVVGVVAGAEGGGGTVTTTTEGSAFSGDMQNMPIEAKPYNYAMNWKIFCYEYANRGKSFPVVSYIVSDISAPPTLPSDFEQVVSETTPNAVTLAWTYDKLVAGFQLYRYYEFPDGTGSHELEFVPFTAAEKYENGKYYFKFTDGDLNPYSSYIYQIQTVSATKPTTSIYSEPMSCRTKTEAGYPVITVDQLDANGKLAIYPDANGMATVQIAKIEEYKSLSYQWQRLEGNRWADISGQTTKTLTISNAGASDVTQYRCRVNAIYYDNATASEYYISAYSDSFATAYSKRTPTYDTANGFTASIAAERPDTLMASIRLYSANANHTSAPTGTVTFHITGTDYESRKTVTLAPSSGTQWLGGLDRYYSGADLELSRLKKGVYKVSAYYSGSRVFKDMTSESKIVIVGAGEAYDLHLLTAGGASVTSFTYGDGIFPELTTIKKGSGGETQQLTLSENVTFKLNGEAFTPGEASLSVGSYTLEAFYKDPMESEAVFAAKQDFVVTQRKAVVAALNQPNVSAADVSSKPPTLQPANLVDSMEDLKLSYKVTNSAGNEITLSNGTDPGNYTVTPCIGEHTDMDIYQNYSFTFISGTYTIIGLTYQLQAIAQDYTDAAGPRPVGTIGISNADGQSAMYTSGTAVMLYASPNPGYAVDKWVAKFADNETEVQEGGNRFNLTTQSQAVEVTVSFKPVSLSLSTAISPSAGGSLSCSDAYFASGATVSTGSEFSFTATPAEGYHFKQWQVGTGGTSSYPVGTANQDGSNTLDVTIGTASMTVYAYFQRDSYTLTLEGDIQAHYDYLDDLSQTVTAEVPSGAAVSGDTMVSISPKTGYQPAQDAVYLVNGQEMVPDDGKISFALTADTVVSLESVQNAYTITTRAENGSVSVQINNVTAENPEEIAVDGGAKAVFTARASRGYVFDYWEVNAQRSTEESETLTIGAVGADQSVVAVFKANTAYTAKAAASPTARGAMLYTLYDIYGGLVGTEKIPLPAEGISVYKGEKITLTVQLAGGSSIENWLGTGIAGQINAKDYTISNISGDIDITVYLRASSSYRVYYNAVDAMASTLGATANGEAFSSSALLGGGSSMAFTAVPNTNRMVSHWTVTMGDTFATEASPLVIDGAKFVDPIYPIDHLIGNITVRAHFTALAENAVELPGVGAQGKAVIVYETPIAAADTGVRSESNSESVRSGGMLVMTVKAASGHGTDVQTITDAVTARVNGDAIVSVTEMAGVFTVTVRNLTSSLSLTESDLYYTLYPITVSEKITASHGEAKAGETVTLTITPDSGYLLDTLILSNGTLIEEVVNTTLVYTFVMPTQSVDVAATFVEEVKPPTGGGGGFAPPITYTITAQAGQGGSISPESKTVSSGENVSFTITPNEGYVIADVLVDGESVGAVSSYTFEKVSKAHTISASFRGESTQPLRPYTGFADVDSQEWYYDGIVFAYENNLMNGVSENEFAPLEKLTRAMVVTILYRMSAEDFDGALVFTDVLDGEWYAQATAWGVETGVVTGYSSTVFAPHNAISREELAVMLYRFAQYMGYDTSGRAGLSGFADAAHVSPWATEAISWAVESGLMKGSDGQISPTGEATRAEVSTMIMRFVSQYVLGEVSPAGAGDAWGMAVIIERMSKDYVENRG